MRALILAAILAIPAAAQADFWTGNNLQERRPSYDANYSNFDSGAYSGYIVGAADMVSGVLWCPPRPVTVGQTVQIVKAYMDAHPAEWAQPATVPILAALRGAFPCRMQ